MILDDIVEKTLVRVAEDKEKVSLEVMRQKAYMTKSKLPAFAFENAIKERQFGFICEVKKASPSKGVIAEDFPYADIACDYERAGAACISCLTEPYFFQGKDEYLTEIKRRVNIPVIRKDFVVDEYMIYQAKVIGADAVLLICSILTDEQLENYSKIAKDLGLSALVETHDEEEVQRALKAGATLIGVNNRNLKDFTVDIGNSMRLRNLVPPEITFIAESGIKTASDIKALKEAKVNGALIGETFMRSPEKTKMLGILDGTRVKICGLRRLEDIDFVNAVKPDYIGFVFAKSKRQIDDRTAEVLRARLMSGIKAVGVFVNEPISHVASLCKKGIIDVVQLHGDETEDYIEALRNHIDVPIIKAFRIKEESDLKDALHSSAELVLLDTFVEGTYGGTGKSFDASMIPGDFRRAVIAGGIDASNVEEIIKQNHPYCIDVSSGVETDGYKDKEKIIEFVQKVRGCYE
ncbi:MAG: bifunctional indole-3-glycerol-phosphate synthase TrpC/phosphoribosylanthranilate isomerase TrpF [Lachnospiraceae bacterium]|nr:bifunctional indole-3-glycerol-phosphate synthase TrpC/phosphoribosylanthranilate isomerase TrpF [Lachnospiraceae bacterium]